MPRLLWAASAVTLTAAWATAEPAPKSKAAGLIVGTWKLVKADQKLPDGTVATIEVTKDGKLKLVVELDGNKQVTPGTYKLDGEAKIVTTLKYDTGDKTETHAIDKLDDKTLAITDEAGQKEVYERVPEKKADKKGDNKPADKNDGGKE